jgi:hypothetical protein
VGGRKTSIGISLEEIADAWTLQQSLGLNQQNKRGSIDDQELFWDENLFPIGEGNLRSCWGSSDPIYTSPGPPIRRIFFGYYGNQTPLFGQPPPGRMGWMFLDDGNVDEVDLDTLRTLAEDMI